MSAIRRLSDEIGGLREAIDRRPEGPGSCAELEKVIHELSESLEELEADNASLHAENERLLAAQEQVLTALDAGLPPEVPRAAAPAESLAIAEENARLRARLSWTEAQVAGLRAVEQTRAWRLVHLYWSWTRRFRRGRSDSRGA